MGRERGGDEGSGEGGRNKLRVVEQVGAKPRNERENLAFMQAKVLGFDSLKEVLQADFYFNPILLAMECDDTVDGYSLYEGYLFHGLCLCVPDGSMRFLIMKEAYNS